ncbi:SusC/RagA family TonB-linked outer membrane protein [Chitinophaga deserti]|uniref:SusC/RagA family TonB-linked outer membrane protein n=1 Tax=Chitinophaga deserti TaxID=2164099 RepID=UPI000D6C38BE|nr:SusC/RagA family TonB-linked outer membrane protein [Chitinophaga deserti]
MKGFWITLLLCLQGSVALMAQSVTLAEKNASLETIFRKVQQQTGISFVYTKTELQTAKPVTLTVTNAPLEKVLDVSFEDQPLTWARQGKYIVVKAAVVRKPTAAPADSEITGRVTDAKGQPVSGAIVVVKGTQNAAYTDDKGNFTLNNVPDDAVLIVRMMGFKQKEVEVKGRKLKIELESVSQQINEVVVTTGLFTRKKESFTGATATFTGEQLKTVGNQDVVKSLRTLDPSFQVVPNNTLGSNPNGRPTIEVRGQTGISSFQSQQGIDPNQPLFILDGFEVTLQQVVDLDINRVASITLLKDAASTAIYGAKAANGVVVIETIKPKPGQMRLTYTSDLTFDTPDLRDYNLMDAAEKLEFERLAGRYNTVFFGPNLLQLDSMYNRRRAAVARGVNTYWLKAPLQNAFSQRHSIYADGGDDAVRYGIGANYRRNQGVMKGSGRNTYGINLDLIYRKGRFNISNKAFFTGVKSEESPYGSFSEFTKANPYYEMYDENGQIGKYLEYTSDSYRNNHYVTNPLYNSTLRSYNWGKEQTLTDNLAIQYNILDGMQAVAGLSFTASNSGTEVFTDPRHSSFETVTMEKKGKYVSGENRTTSWQTYLALNYGKVLKGGHQVSINLRGDATERQSKGITTTVRGFPYGSNGNPAYGTSYDMDSKLPGYVDIVFRSASGIASANYSFRNRFLMDASLRYDISTSFGSNQYAHAFWSFGLGWNLHNEAFFRDITFINRLKLFINTGTNSNQNYVGMGSTSVYSYAGLYNVAMGQSLDLGAMGNPDLKWPITRNVNMGFDVSFLKSRINATVNYFTKKTTDMVVPLSMPPSTGFSTFNTNLGGMDNQGIEITARVTPWANPQRRAAWNITLNGLWQNSEFNGLGKALEQQNSKFASDSVLAVQFQRYRDGYSQYDLWAVRSLGIDPGTGREVFLKKDGTRTFAYDPQDIVVVGNSRPTMEGVVGTNLNYEGFNIGVYFRYRFGGQQINTALYNKVEDIKVEEMYYNLDRRALYDRWVKAGDVAQYRGFSEVGKNGTVTNVSSRFVQKDENFTGESISFGYEFSQSKWIKKLGLENLRLNAYLNEFVRWSTIRAERGMDYPFTRSGSLSINASF